jgi:sugar fermentation stimulation protein A
VGLVSARFLERPHRFAAAVELGGGRRAVAHLGDPGRLRELLLPGAELRLRPAARPGRKLPWTVALVRSPSEPRVWVSVEPARGNALAEELLSAGRVRGAGGRGVKLRREVTRGASRFDFVLERGGERTWVEVKSVTLVENGIGLFPDAPTARGRRHVAELREIVAGGGRALVLFVVQRSDARAVRAHRGIDPAFAAALREARAAGVMLRAAGFRLDANAEATWTGALPVRS